MCNFTKNYFIYTSCLDPGAHYIGTKIEGNRKRLCPRGPHERYVVLPGCCPQCDIYNCDRDHAAQSVLAEEPGMLLNWDNQPCQIRQPEAEHPSSCSRHMPSNTSSPVFQELALTDQETEAGTTLRNRNRARSSRSRWSDSPPPTLSSDPLSATSDARSAAKSASIVPSRNIRRRATDKEYRTEFREECRQLRSLRIRTEATATPRIKYVAVGYTTEPEADYKSPPHEQLVTSNVEGQHGDGHDDSTPPRSSTSEEDSEASGYLDKRRQQILESVISSTTEWIQSRFETERQAAGSSQNNPERQGGTQGRRSGDTSQLSGSSKDRAKRKLDPRDASGRGDGDDDETGDDNHPKGSTKRVKEQPIQVALFACPYFRHNPAKYQHWHNCTGPGWPDTHRVKEHLYRRHRQPRHICGRCQETFGDEQSFLDHQRAEVPCLLRPVESVEGFNSAQETQLRSRKTLYTKTTEISKWKAVFKILFPDVQEKDIPTPFYEYDRVYSQQTVLRECEQFVLREVPVRLRRILVPELDRNLAIVEESLQRKASECVTNIVAEVFREFRERFDVPADQETTAGSEAEGSRGKPNLTALSSTGDIGPKAGSAENLNLCYDLENMIDTNMLRLDSNFPDSQGDIFDIFDFDISMDSSGEGTGPESSDSGYKSRNSEELLGVGSKESQQP